MSDINGMIQSDYYDKGCDYSVTDFTKADYMLWVSKNFDKDDDIQQSLAPWIGQLIHKASYEYPETDVIKEFSGSFTFNDRTIGGSIDRLAYNGSEWVVEDLKSQGMYPAKQAFVTPSESWITQLSIYRYMMEKQYGLKMSNQGVIHQYVLGFRVNKEGMEPYNRIVIDLLDDKSVEELMKRKMEVAEDEEPENDCPKWLCKYCDYTQSCPANNQTF